MKTCLVIWGVGRVGLTAGSSAKRGTAQATTRRTLTPTHNTPTYLGQAQREEHHLVHELPVGVHPPLVPEPNVLGEDAQVRLPVEEQGHVHPQMVQRAAQLLCCCV